MIVDLTMCTEPTASLTRYVTAHANLALVFHNVAAAYTVIDTQSVLLAILRRRELDRRAIRAVVVLAIPTTNHIVPRYISTNNTIRWLPHNLAPLVLWTVVDGMLNSPSSPSPSPSSTTGDPRWTSGETKSASPAFTSWPTTTSFTAPGMVADSDVLESTATDVRMSDATGTLSLFQIPGHRCQS